ncbi:hypothetical protein FisN_18Lh167 [Fistulifera solaris]|uniref:Uncharacterized protein n=1 Tax=Fistulifera solaris TaxID=1519565 RepID=A0A1Z5JUK0_FISSO|nr:hypothetical protein FisN_18Lh167 [Fistulifera solaris]|eukprot:GAX17522.1 hypothetical protein FisN_18Lh167 [Fistulifera solaris]
MPSHRCSSLFLVLWISSGASVLSFTPSDPTPCRSFTRLFAIKVTMRMVGKRKAENWLEEGCDMYASRLRSAGIDWETVMHKSDEALTQGVEGDLSKGHAVVLLDPFGKQYKNSDELASSVYDWFEVGGSRLSLVIGGAEGLPSEVKSLVGILGLWSLSHLTLPHQLARLVVMEQIYRASEIRKGSSYNK